MLSSQQAANSEGQGKRNKEIFSCFPMCSILETPLNIQRMRADETRRPQEHLFTKRPLGCLSETLQNPSLLVMCFLLLPQKAPPAVATCLALGTSLSIMMMLRRTEDFPGSQGLRFYLPMQGVPVQFLVRELDPTCIVVKSQAAKQKQYC